ncbi:MAG: iron uptake porin [Elainellaceae cyanobacterium]
MVFRYGFAMLVSGSALAGVFCLAAIPTSATETVPRAIEDEIANVALAQRDVLVDQPEANRGALDHPQLDHSAVDTPALDQAAGIYSGRSPQSTETLLAEVPRSSAMDSVPSVRDIAAETRDSNHSMAQVTSVTQLSDVQPTDWAFQALQSLVERYGCIVGYPDMTYRGNRALTRYEFAAGVNACLDRINDLIAAGLADTVSRDDLEVLQRLQEEFAAELATLRGRVDALEARVAEVEANQFSTTTKLNGEAIFRVTDRFGDDDDNQTVFQNRVRLDLVTSFTGEDALHTRLAVGNVEPFSGPGTYPSVNAATAEGILSPRISGNTEGDVVLDWLGYYFPIQDRIQVYLAAAGGIHSDYVYSTASPFFQDFDGGRGGLSAFSQESPIYRIGGGAGMGVNFSFDDESTFVLTGGYFAEEAADPSPGSGLFNGDYAALGQFTFSPGDKFQLALTYVHGYHTANNIDGQDTNFIFDQGFTDEFFTGTVPANATHIELETPAVTNSYGVQASFQVSSNFVINAFGGFTNIRFIETGDGEIWYYGLGLGFPDLLQEGNFGGLMVGVEPYLGGVDGDFIFVENDTSLHVEAFYRYQITDNISITPGVVWLTAPDQNNDNSDIVVGTLRTTFSF